MNIVVELKGRLKEFCIEPDNAKNIELCLGSSTKVLDVIKKLNIIKEYIALITVNKKVTDFNFELKDGDRIVFYPPIGGG